MPQVPRSPSQTLDIETWVSRKLENEVDMVGLRPDPAEFALYFDR